MHVLEELTTRSSHDASEQSGSAHTGSQMGAPSAAKSTAERRLEALLEQLPYVILYETGGGREYISQNIEKLLGYSADELTAERGRFLALIHPSDNALLNDRLNEWTARGRPGVFTAQFRVKKRTGEYIWLEDQIISIENENGSEGMIGVMVDVSRRHSAQARYQAIVEAADVAGIGLAILVNREGLPTVLYSNAAAYSIGGRSAKEVFDEPVTKFIPEDEQPKIFDLWNRFLQGQLVNDSLELDVLHKEGRRVPVSCGVSSIALDEEPAIIAFMTDITERRRAEQALVEARVAAEEISHIKSNILSNFSHELRTPLHSILGFSSLLVEELPEGELREYARSVERSGQRLLSTVTSIIEVAQLESGVSELVAYPVSIAEVVKAEGLAIKEQVEAKGLEFRLSIESEDMIVLLERTRFRKAFDKILHNAVKFTQAGSVEIALTHESPKAHSTTEYAAIRIRDTGIGMSPEFVKTAFEKFKQESSGFNRSFEGTGLGLPIARSHIRMMSGTIEIESEPGAGTTVTIRFPVVGHIGA